MKIYSVSMYRWGSREAHSYIYGIYDSMEKALEAKKKGEEDRGGKYEGEVLRHEMNIKSIGNPIDGKRIT